MIFILKIPATCGTQFTNIVIFKTNGKGARRDKRAKSKKGAIMKKQNKATKQKAKKSTNAKTGSAVSKPAKKKSKSTSQRYSAKLVNGKGYIFDKKFSEKVPIAVETTMEFAEKQVEKFNKEEKSAGKNSTKKTAVTKKKETAAAKPAAPKPAAKTEEKSTSINTSATKERRGIQNFLEVKSVLKSGTA